MAAPKNPNPGPGARERRRIGDRTAALRLTAAGWTCHPPQTAVTVPLRCGTCGTLLVDPASLTAAVDAIIHHTCPGGTP